MKNRFVRTTALLLSAVLTLGPAASASQALGTEIHYGTVHLAEGVDYTRQHLWSATYSDLRTEHYLEYRPNELIQPALAYGDTVLSKNTLSALASTLEAEGQRVLGGINGDYFVIATGAPLGVVITDGILRSSSSYLYALGFAQDGSAFIGKPDLSITATFGGQTLSIDGGLNKVRGEAGGYYLYTDDYSTTTQHTDAGIDVILSPNMDKLGQKVEVDLSITDADDQISVSDPEDTGTPLPNEENAPIIDSSDLDFEILEGLLPALPGQDEPSEPEPKDTIHDTLVYTDIPVIGGRISCTVEQILQSTGSIEIPEGKLVLSIHGNGNEWLISQLTALQRGDTVDIDIFSEDERWEQAVTAVGGLYKMVTGGVVESGLETSQAPRTAVGIRADGSTVFYAVDGRQSGYSVGASMAQVAQRLVELGCVEAVCMDGGGSTTLGASLPGKDSFDILNQPSDGSQRPVSNALFLVAEQTSPGWADHLSLSPNDAIMLSGSQLELSAVSVDKLGQAVNQYSADRLVFTLPAEAGSVQNGTLTAGNQAGTYTLTASIGSLTGSALITVVPSPNRIALHDEAAGTALSTVRLDPGEKIDLTANVLYCNLPLVCSDEDLVWTVSENIGTIDPGGTLTAGRQNGTGFITVTAGDYTASIPVTVAGHITTREDFEGNFLSSTNTIAAQIEAETRSAYVRRGTQSARISYDLSGSEFAAVSMAMKLSEKDRYLTLWVYGDGSGNILSTPVQLRNGEYSEQLLTVLDFNGWRQITASLPEGAHQLLGFRLAPSGTAASGTICLDQITSSNQAMADNTAPIVSVALSEGTLTAAVQDNMDETFSMQQISVTYDGLELSVARNGAAITAALPAYDGLAHRVTVTATDASGNIGRASADITASAQRAQPFADMEGHWANSYVTYLYDQGISNGVASGNTFLFNPDKNITRGEFALMVSRWLRLNPAQYSDVELPFADLNNIPSWTLDAIKAMYELGIMTGSAEAGGTYAFAERSITRAEAMTMLGRVQAKGYVQAELTFADTNAVPSWAAEYVATLVAQGVVNGYGNNTIAPNSFIKRCEMAKVLYAMR